jgi:hypothetical protein
MTSYRVVYDNNRWEVMKAASNFKSHRTISTHSTKASAKRKARRLANDGDSLTLLRKDGAIQDRKTIR